MNPLRAGLHCSQRVVFIIRYGVRQDYRCRSGQRCKPCVTSCFYLLDFLQNRLLTDSKMPLWLSLFKVTLR